MSKICKRPKKQLPSTILAASLSTILAAPFMLSPLTGCATENDGYYLDQQATQERGGVANYVFQSGSHGPSGHPLADSAKNKQSASRYNDQATTAANHGVSNYQLPGDQATEAEEVVATSDDAGYYTDQDAAQAVGGVSNYAFHPGDNGPTGHPLAAGQTNNRYVDQKTAENEGGVSNYILPGDQPKAQQAGKAAPAPVAAPPQNAQADEIHNLLVDLGDKLLFDLNKSDLRADAKPSLEKLGGILKNDPTAHVKVMGFTDSTGSVAFNDELSKKRADVVEEFLVSSGASPDQITTEGFGEKRPVASNDTAEGRQQNRRAELSVKG